MLHSVKIAASLLLLLLCLVVAVEAVAQSGYQVVQLAQAGTISGNVRWSGPLPRIPAFPI
jgi:hypothetical protein